MRYRLETPDCHALRKRRSVGSCVDSSQGAARSRPPVCGQHGRTGQPLALGKRPTQAETPKKQIMRRFMADLK